MIQSEPCPKCGKTTLIAHKSRHWIRCHACGSYFRDGKPLRVADYYKNNGVVA